jgi:hypothetical protein
VGELDLCGRTPVGAISVPDLVFLPISEAKTGFTGPIREAVNPYAKVRLRF